ncbi:MAG: hypothetical protein RJA81_356, partial [Planctomycetota bacterium]
ADLEQSDSQTRDQITIQRDHQMKLQNEANEKAKLSLEEQYKENLVGHKKKRKALQDEAERQRDEKVWHASTHADSQKGNVESQFNQLRRKKNELSTRLEQLLEHWGAIGVFPDFDDSDDESTEDHTHDGQPLIFGSLEKAPDLSSFEKMVQETEVLGHRLTGFLPRRIFKLWSIPLFAGTGFGIAVASGLTPWIPAILGSVVSLVGYFASRVIFQRKAEKTLIAWDHTNAAVQSLDHKIQYWRDSARLAIDQELEDTREQANDNLESAIRVAQVDFEGDLEKLESSHKKAISDLDKKNVETLAVIESEASSRLSAQQTEFENQKSHINQVLQEKLQKAEHAYQDHWETICKSWTQRSDQMNLFYQSWKAWRSAHAPVNWSELNLDSPAQSMSQVIAMGQVKISPDQLPELISPDKQLTERTPKLDSVPLVRPLPSERSTIWIQAPPGRRVEMTALLQTLAMRSLTAFPPGQVRFTLVDPVGLGQTFAGLLHLADFEPALVNQRPWSEARDIELRLAELTAHLEFVVQNYLRNQYENIEAYNRDAGEVAEAYRILILADYPNAISEDSARRLRRLIEAGARCGSYVIIGQDLSQTGTIDPSQAELRSHIDRIVWSNDKGRWSWPANPLDRFEIQWDSPPKSETATEIVRRFGSLAKSAMRVEVPFSVVAPKKELIWSQSCDSVVDIPLGRAGARQLQSLRLGEGTSQHVLLAGRTGSGKSTLLHAIITNAALRYSPEELELYLIDFKKGVEFKKYATRQLPHARVVAVESEREFGLSVLERLDRELTLRGEKFRKAGVQDVAGYRRSEPSDPLPRILLVVDEFQELFNEDDRIATDSAGLLDRLVRQGRAFGIHAILGSQSMAGAYAIARSTLGQMGIRIALQCNENDSRLILSEDNPAARMLSRPGEAIYNDANGLTEGNHLFQAVWISDQDREERLAQIHEMAEAQGWQRDEPMIVFEGQGLGDMTRNRQLQIAVKHRQEHKPDANPVMWLGESVTISDPPVIRFERQPASNLLVVGRQSQEIRAMLASGLIGIWATSPSAEIRVVESPPAGEPSLASQLQTYGIENESIAPAELKSGLTGLWNELRSRQDDPPKAICPIIIVMSDIARLRDLRKSDDDYGFGGFGGGEPAPPSPLKMLSEILREGPSVAIHTILWADGSVSMQNATDRTAMNEFGTMVVFQTTAADSTHFLDNVAASRLQRWQALLVRPAESESLKIRPYGLTDPRTIQQWQS